MSDVTCSCKTCYLVWIKRNRKINSSCPRCMTPYRPENVRVQYQQSLALVISGYILYIPANVFPIMVIDSFGEPTGSTIFEGMRDLILEGMYPIAGIVFLASIAIPMLKLLGMSILLMNFNYSGFLATKNASRLLMFIRTIGRWSMLDVLMVFFLSGLIQIENITSIQPGIGLVAFSMVVLVTIIAAEKFDSRWLWLKEDTG